MITIEEACMGSRDFSFHFQLTLGSLLPSQCLSRIMPLQYNTLLPHILDLSYKKSHALNQLVFFLPPTKHPVFIKNWYQQRFEGIKQNKLIHQLSPKFLLLKVWREGRFKNIVLTLDLAHKLVHCEISNDLPKGNENV